MADSHLDHHSASSVPSQQPAAYDDEVNLLEYWRVIWKRRWLILAMFSAAVSVALMVSLQLPKIYIARAVALPSKSQEIPGMPELTGKTLVSLLKSRSIADRLVKEYHLVKVYQAETPEDARRILENNTNAKLSRENALEVEVEAKDPALAAQLANSYIDALAQSTQAMIVEKAAQWRRSLEARLSTLEREIAPSEEPGVYAAGAQAKDVSQGGAQDGDHAVAPEASGTVRSMGDERSRVEKSSVDMWLQIEYLRGKLSSVLGEGNAHARDNPAIQLAMRRGLDHLRQSAQSVRKLEEYMHLVGELDTAKGLELQPMPVLTVVDPATAPVRPSKPRIALNVAIAGVLGLLAAIFLAFFLEYLQRVRQQRPGDV